MSQISKISAAEYRTLKDAPNVVVLDVRDRNEFAEAHESGSTNFPLGEITAASAAALLKSREIGPEKTIVLLCARGMRAQKAAEALSTLVPNKLAVVEGGRAALAPADAPMSIERQVRIAAGSLVLLGVLGSLFIHPAMLFISGFVGAGLVFAGITDWCGMGLLMMKMPWNRR